MKDELLVEHLEIIVGEMKRLKNDHPKARITFDTEKNRVNITYPLPKDFWEIKSIKFNENK